MSEKDDGGYAFPIVVGEHMTTGMTLRDWFAGQALAGLLASHVEAREWLEPKQAAEMSGEYADAMLAERNK